jgi:hypothetical protein
LEVIKMTIPKKEAPILVAEFPGEKALSKALKALEEQGVGRDFIGVLITEDGHEPNGQRWLHLLSVLAPSRLHEGIRSAFVQSGATAVGSPKEMADNHGPIPHPGAFEDHDMKLPMGLEYPDVGGARRRG